MTTDHMVSRKPMFFSSASLSSKTVKSEFTWAKRFCIWSMTLDRSTEESNDKRNVGARTVVYAFELFEGNKCYKSIVYGI